MILKLFLENASPSATYKCHFTMRKFQEIGANLVSQKITIEVTKYFSIMFGETCDVSGKQMFTLVVRYF